MSYVKNKINRMKIKYSNILSKDFGIIASDSPTQIICVCNGGVCTGIDQEMIYDSFQKYGTMEKIVMVSQKSYSFVKFKDENDAVEAFNSLNGKKIWKEIKGPVYLLFIKNINFSDFQQFSDFQNPPGLVLIKDFISEEDENLFLNVIEFDEKKNSSELKHRRVKHYGFEFKYSTNNVDLNEPIDAIPKELNILWEKLKNDHQIDFVPDQLTVNKYEPGQGIPPHVDTHSAFEDGILSLSLLSSTVMEFKNKDGNCYKVFLPRRSLCLMLGESRYDWTHRITPRKSDVVLDENGYLRLYNRGTRISLTFRKTRIGDCTCDFPRLCDSYLKRVKSNKVISDMKNLRIKEELASDLEESYVHEVYDKIASHFSETRHKPWPKVMKFVESFPLGSIVVDIGCGNGKYFTKNSHRFEIGCDSSSSLMLVCRQQDFECFSCNCLNIPIRDNVVDGCICIAVIHHLTTEERRRKAIKEIVRILKSKGRALIYVWAKNQVKESQKSNYVKHCGLKGNKEKNETVELVKLQNELVLPVHVNRTNFSFNDLLVPWKLKTKNSKSNDSVQPSVFLRFYHVYEDEELKSDCLELDNIEIVDYYYDQGNWCISLQKK